MTSTLFFIASKFVGLLILGETWLVAGLILAVIAHFRGRPAAAARWTGLVLAAVVALALFPVGNWVTGPLEARYPLEPALSSPPDGIIVLGGAVEVGIWKETGQMHFNEAGERMYAAALLARRYPDAKIILSGGGATLAEFGEDLPSEADVMAEFVTDFGIASKRLVLEGTSRNTAANAAFSFDLVAPGPGQRWVLVTSSWHMPRAMAAFERAGWTGLTAWPVDLSVAPDASGLTWDLSVNLFILNRAVKEYVGAAAYALAAKL